jgi:SAM-dependent methyltransferase
MLQQVQRLAVPELTRVYGQYGLYLHPSPVSASPLSGNMIANMVALRRHGQAMSGQVRCADGELPFASGTLSLVYALFMLETSPEPAALLEEIARCLKPEGVLLLISLNPLSPARLRGRWSGALRKGVSDERLARDAGLELIRSQHLGPFWPSSRSAQAASSARNWFDRFRAARLLVLRHREAALTPLRKVAPAVSLRPGMSAG